MKICGRGNGGAEPKDDVQRIKRNVGHGEAVAVQQRGGQQVEQAEEPKGRNEHVVVDHGRVAGKGRGDHVADKTHDDDGADELAKC